jgi:uncharacterized protein YndB with AHSA1/START domain/uncharacterized protein YciI
MARRMVLLAGFLLSGLLLAAAGGEPAGPAPALAQEEETMTAARPVHFLVQLDGTRAGWPEAMTEREEQVMGEHFVYLQNLMHRGKVLLAGPVMDPVWGLIVLEVADEAEARAIMDVEPSVTSGVLTYTLHPFVASLQAGREVYASSPAQRRLEKEVLVPASRGEVWQAWTTAEGLETFFAEDAVVEMRPGGRFEIRFSATAPEGQRGSEGCRVLAFLPEQMLAFSWNAPPSIPEIRKLRTQVVLTFEDADSARTRVRLVNYGYGQGAEWDKAFAYFDRAWGVVLANLKERFEKGSLD